MSLLIEGIRKREIVWSLRGLAKMTKKIWKTNVMYFDPEHDAEYKLTIAKSKRLEDEIDTLAEMDLELNWGCERIPGKKEGTYSIRKTGDFNPWYQGDLTLDELLDALEGLYSYSLSAVEPPEEDIEFATHYEKLEKYKQSLSPKKTYGYTPEVLWEMLHPDLLKVSKPRYESGHYADAVEAAFKHINAKVKDIVKKKTGQEWDGADLMMRAMSVHAPVMELGNLKTQTGKNMQVGYSQIFAGSMTGIRNPKAHENITIDKLRASHFLFLASLLLSKIDEAKIPRTKNVKPPEKQ